MQRCEGNFLWIINPGLSVGGLVLLVVGSASRAQCSTPEDTNYVFACGNIADYLQWTAFVFLLAAIILEYIKQRSR
jgi:hypothetical protein